MMKVEIVIAGVQNSTTTEAAMIDDEGLRTLIHMEYNLVDHPSMFDHVCGRRWCVGKSKALSSLRTTSSYDSV